MSKLLLASALVAALCGPALAQNTGGNGGGNQNQNQGGVQGAPGPVAGAGLTGIAIALGGLGIYWVVTRRQRQI